MHTFSKDQLITPWTMRKSVQEGNAQKLTNLSIWMHLSQKKIHLTTLDLRKDILLLCIHKKKTTLPILGIYICWMYIFTNLGHIKTPDFTINQLQRDKGKFSSWKQVISRRGLTNERPGNWSCDLRANESSWYKLNYKLWFFH